MKWLASVALVVGVVAVSGPVLADCPVGPGDSAVITVPKGKALRIMYTTPRPDRNWLQVCTRDGTSGEFWPGPSIYPFFRSEWVFMWMRYTQPTDYQLTFFGDLVDERYVHRPWAGARRTNTPTGYTLAWYDAAGPDKPVTIVEVCIYADSLDECPPH